MIGTVPLFARMSKKNLKSVAEIGRRLSYDPARKIVKQGEKGIGFYLVLEGDVEVRKGQRILAKLGKGDFFGEMSLLDSQPRSADVIAVSPTTCFGITGWSFSKLLENHSEMIPIIINVLTQRLRNTNESLTE